MKSRFSRARAKNKIMVGLIADAVERQRQQDEETLVPALNPMPSCSSENVARVDPVIHETDIDPISRSNDNMGINENEGRISDESDSNGTDDGMDIELDTNADVHNDQDVVHQVHLANDTDAEDENPEFPLPQQLDPNE